MLSLDIVANLINDGIKAAETGPGGVQREA